MFWGQVTVLGWKGLWITYPNSVVHSPVVTAAVCVEVSAQLCVCLALVGCGNTHLGILE